MAGIDSLVNTRAEAFTNNPQGLMQRYAMSKDLLDLLALQKLKQDKEAAQRSLQMQMQAPQNTVKDQLEGQVMDMTKREVAQAVAPGLQQQAQRMQAEQLQQAMGAGLGGLQAPAALGMAEGGIVGYAEGDAVNEDDPVVDYDAQGMPITRSQYEARQKSAMEMTQYAKEHPLKTAAGAILALTGAGELGMAGEGLASLEGASGIEALGPNVMRAAKAFFRKPNPAFVEKVTEKGTRLYPANVPETLFSPGRTAATSSGLFGLDALRDYLSGGDSQAALDAVAQLTAPVTRESVLSKREPPRKDFTMEELLGGKYVPETKPAPAAQAEAPTQVKSQGDLASQLAGLYSSIVNTGKSGQPMEDAISRITKAVAADPASQYASPATSRYEQQLKDIEAQKQDKMGALVDFLLAAGASGGTNLGATLTGGGSGLRAREERLGRERAEAMKNIEDLQFKDRQIAAENLRARQNLLGQAGIEDVRQVMEQDRANKQLFGTLAGHLLNTQSSERIAQLQAKTQMDIEAAKEKILASKDATTAELRRSLAEEQDANKHLNALNNVLNTMSEKDPRYAELRALQQNIIIQAALRAGYTGVGASANAYPGFSATRIP